MHQLKMICYDSFFYSWKNEFFFLRHKNYCKKQNPYQNCGGKEKSAECYIANEDALKENAKNQYRDFLKKKKKQRENIGETDVET